MNFNRLDQQYSIHSSMKVNVLLVYLVPDWDVQMRSLSKLAKNNDGFSRLNKTNKTDNNKSFGEVFALWSDSNLALKASREWVCFAAGPCQTHMRQGADNLWWWPEENIRKWNCNCLPFREDFFKLSILFFLLCWGSFSLELLFFFLCSYEIWKYEWMTFFLAAKVWRRANREVRAADRILIILFI